MFDEGKTAAQMDIRKRRTIAVSLFFIHAAALGIFIPTLFSWSAVIVAVGSFGVAGLAVTLGFHRLLTHRSFVVARPVEYFIATIGVLALQGGPISWVAVHRAHHANTDRDGDPHNASLGMPWAHFKWLIYPNGSAVAEADFPRWAPELAKDPFYRFLESYHVFFTVALGVAFLILGGWSWVIWGIFFRLVIGHHATWLVNSAAHGFGYQTYKTNDRSRNNWLVSVVAFGEGWHNNHHAFQFSARHGLRWFELDPTYLMIRMLALFRIATNVKVPTEAMISRLAISSPIEGNAA